MNCPSHITRRRSGEHTYVKFFIFVACIRQFADAMQLLIHFLIQKGLGFRLEDFDHSLADLLPAISQFSKFWRSISLGRQISLLNRV